MRSLVSYRTEPLKGRGPSPTPNQGHSLQESVGRLLTQRDVSDIFGVTLRTIQRWSKDGVLPVVRVGGTTRYHPDHITGVIEGSTEVSR